MFALDEDQGFLAIGGFTHQDDVTRSGGDEVSDDRSTRVESYRPEPLAD
jgi:hypothetical protein